MSDDEYFEPEIYNQGNEPEYIITDIPTSHIDTAIIRLNNAFDILENLLMPFEEEQRNQLSNAFEDALSVYATNQTLAFNIISKACSERTLQNELLDTVMLVRSRMNGVELAIRNDPENPYISNIANRLRRPCRF
jgi:hypothetical protein